MDLDDNKPFVWRKKYEELGVEIDEKEIEAERKRRIEENRVELEKIRERQRRRELEFQQKLNDSEFLRRQKDTEQHEQWEQQEGDFMLRQHRHRSKIRIRDGRAKPIDLLAYYIEVFGYKPDTRGKSSGYIQEEEIDLSDSPVELLNPCEWFNGLRKSDLEALVPDIETYMSADCEENQQYWDDVLEIAKIELTKLQAATDMSKSTNGGAINSAVLNEVVSMFEGKRIGELNQLEDEMQEVLNSNEPSVDVSFYTSAIERLRAYRAKLRLTQRHKDNLKRQKNKILHKTEEKPASLLHPKYESEYHNVASTSGVEVEQQDVEMKDHVKNEAIQSRVARKLDKELEKGSNQQGREETEVEEAGDIEQEQDEDEDEDEDEGQLDEDADDEQLSRLNDQFEKARLECMEEYERGRYTPDKLESSEVGAICLDYQTDYELLCRQRKLICNASSLDEAQKATMSSEERAFIEAASKGMDSREESTFGCEAAVRGPNNRLQTYAWADKYQPRKPRYFNRVHTGFEWNKYNQTHYDIDNPPPKVVQGYKFNIFYPDLIDKSKAPSYKVTPCDDDRDFCIIRFSAGPPYEDIAFRIVNREWNSSHKSGYRCQFINNMLQLWFQFKRYRYRR